MFRDIDLSQIDGLAHRSWQAFRQFSNLPLKRRADLMRAVADELEALGDELIRTAMEETHLPEARLLNERGRTAFQLRSYADACERGDWMDIRIDRADPSRTPPKPDIRKTMVPLGPVVVYGASNFPFAYSTAGGDTASAFAAGCSVIVKAHPAHPATSEAVAGAVRKALSRCRLPEDLFLHIHGASPEVGRALVTHEKVKAVGFTGSSTAGRALFDWANARREPIPVFAEMGSVNPVFLMPNKTGADAEGIAKAYAGSITLGCGQFCTKPGLIFGVEGPALDRFMETLGGEVSNSPAARMLHAGIAAAYGEKKEKALSQEGVRLVRGAAAMEDGISGSATIAIVDAPRFIRNPLLHQEVFGPYSLVVRCRDTTEMLEAAEHLDGQLTCTVMGDERDVEEHPALMARIREICGRVIMNGVPTGVEVCLSMQHGGPYPATTDSRFGSVGADAIRRFCRPLSYQNWPDSLLPEELKDANPLGILRTIDNEPTRGTLPTSI
jgi:alpha-ketoglutaric semialdehyde dehydrogenase